MNDTGYSRGSTPLNSSVLTEETDDFIVGDRVWVNGRKAGYIQYIGDTKFASGEWAGVVLDEATGKNDGSVSGIRYFQCEPLRGVFARLHRLTRYPLFDDGSNDYLDNGRVKRTTSKSPDGRTTRTTTTRMSKSPVVPSYALPARPNKVVTTVTTTTTTVEKPLYRFRLGDKVIVNSSRGMQSGRIRYIGRPHFATGEWVGVELDEPYGKNDGTVDGKRYFSCPNKYGLFAPTYKVLKGDPSQTITKTSVTNTGPNIWSTKSSKEYGSIKV